MKITKINTNFPILNVGDFINLDAPNVGIHKNCRVLAVWYPKHGDKWSEREECKHIGYLNSRADEMFPQIIASSSKGTIRMFGDDDKYITRIGKFIPTNAFEKLLLDTAKQTYLPDTIYRNDKLGQLCDFTVDGNFRFDKNGMIWIDGRLTNPNQYNEIGSFVIYKDGKWATTVKAWKNNTIFKK